MPSSGDNRSSRQTPIGLWAFAIFWNIFLIPFWYFTLKGQMKGDGSIYLLYAMLGLFQTIGVFFIFMALMAARWQENISISGEKREIVNSMAKGETVMMGFFAIIWNAFSWILFYALYIDNREAPLFVGGVIGLFILAGIFIAGKAFSDLLQAKRFGNIQLVMDPYPGSIGGEAGGTVDLPVPFNAANRFEAAINCIHSITDRSGKKRQTTKTLLWQETKEATQEPCAAGTRIGFKFSIPDSLPESEESSNDYRYWSFRVSSGDIPGIDLAQEFTVDVKKTAIPLRSAVRETISTDTRPRSPRWVSISQGDSGSTRFYYPARRNTGTTLLLLCLSAFLGLVGYVIGGMSTSMVREAESFGAAFLIFSVIFIGSFGLVASLSLAYALYLAFNSLEVTVSHGTIRSAWRFFGIFVVKRREMSLPDISSFEYKNTLQMGKPEAGKVKISLIARSKDGDSMVVGDGISGFTDAGMIRSMFEALTSGEGRQ